MSASPSRRPIAYRDLPTEAAPRGRPLDALAARAIVRRLVTSERATVRAALAESDVVARVAERAAVALAAGGRLVYAGAGTSGRLAALDAAECPPTFGVAPGRVIAIVAGGRRALARAVEGAEDGAAGARSAVRRLRLGAHDLLVAITASGITPFPLAALEEARAAGAFTVLLTCAPRPRHRALCDELIGPRVGPEAIAGSTRLKAGTATKILLNALSTTTMVLLGKIHEGRMVDLVASNAKLRDRAIRIVGELTGLPEQTARRLLARAGGRPKLALAMHGLGLSRREAERRLARTGGRLRPLLEAGP